MSSKKTMPNETARDAWDRVAEIRGATGDLPSPDYLDAMEEELTTWVNEIRNKRASLAPQGVE